VSKAFTGEDASEAALVVPPRPPLPPGVTNYVTPLGYAALRTELERLLSRRARLEAAGGDAEATRALAAVAARLVALEARIASATVVEPSSQPHDEVRFGALVTVRPSAGAERRYRIVGVDEAEADRVLVAFVAPIARALLGKRVGDVATVVAPRGREDLEIVGIEYR
jgi:transcription elongation factor GreB